MRVFYRATPDVPITTVRTISGWLTAHRRTHDIRPYQRAADDLEPGRRRCCSSSKTAPRYGPWPATLGSRKLFSTSTSTRRGELLEGQSGPRAASQRGINCTNCHNRRVFERFTTTKNVGEKTNLLSHNTHPSAVGGVRTEKHP